MNYIKKSVAALMVIVLLITSMPLRGFVGFEIPGWLSLSSAAIGLKEEIEEKTDIFKEFISQREEQNSSEVEVTKNYVSILPSMSEELFDALDEEIKAYAQNAPSVYSVPGRYTLATLSDEEEEPSDEIEEEEILFDDSGTINETIEWTFTAATKTLEVSGSGAIPSYYPRFYYNGSGLTEEEINTLVAPWDKYLTVVEKLVIGEGIISIGEANFASCINLTDLVFSEGLTSIGPSCFLLCTDLECVSFPSTLDSIGEESFIYAYSLKEIYFNEGLKTIGDYSFDSVVALNNLYLPSTLESFDMDFVFIGEGEATINSSDEVSLVVARITEGKEQLWKTGLLYEKMQFEYLCGFDNDFVFVEETNTLEFMKMFIPEYNKIIGTTYDPENMYDLYTVLVILENAIIDPSSFIQYCADENFVMNVPEDSYAHNVCSKMLVKHKLINTEEECECFILEDTTFGSVKWSVDKESKTLTFSGSGEIDDVFSYYSNYVDYVAFSDDSNITAIGANAFMTMDITEITIPDSVKVIKNKAFYNCGKLESVVIENISRTELAIWTEAFGGCSSLKEIYLPAGVNWISDDAFKGSGLEKITIINKSCQIGDTGKSSTIPYNAVICGYGDSTAEAFATTNSRSFECLDEFSVDMLEFSVGQKNGFEGQVAVVTGYNGKAKDVVIPAEVDGVPVVAIGTNAFYNNRYIRNVTLPDTVELIDYYAFYNSRVQNIHLNSNLTSIGYHAFMYCSYLEKVYIDNLSDWFDITLASSYANPLYYADEFYAGGELVKDLVIPEEVTKINSYSFYGYDALRSVTLHQNVEYIGNNAFNECEGLEAVYAKDLESWLNIEFDGFSYLLRYADSLYFGDELVEEIIIPEGITEIKGYAFNGYERLASVSLPSTLEVIGISAFSGTAITEITIPKSVTSMGYAFSSSEKLETIAFEEGRTEIPEDAMYNCIGLKTAVIPTGVETIERYAFYGCESLETINIPSSLKFVDNYAFAKCENLKSVYADSLESFIAIDFYDYDGNPAYYTDKLYFGEELVESLDIPEGITSVCDYAFCGYERLCEVTFPSTLEEIGWHAFSYTSLTEVFLPASLTSVDTSFAYCDNLETAEFEEGMTGIPYSALRNCTGLKNVIIPSSVTSFGSMAFYECKNLEKVYAEDFESWNNIDFSINGHPLEYAEKLYLDGELIRNFVIPDGLTKINDYIFYGYKGLTGVTFPDSLEEIGYGSFAYTSIKEITISESLNTISSQAFSYCTSLERLTLSNETKLDVESSAFENCTALETVVFSNEKELNLYDDVFSGCTAIETVTFSNKDKIYIKGSVFYGCENIKNVYADSIASYNNIEYWDINGNPLSYGADLYIGGKLLTELTVNEITPITTNYAFSGCTSLKSVTFEKGVTAVMGCCFSDCVNLESVVFSEGIETISWSAFYNCQSIKSIELPDSVTKIEGGAFNACINLEDVSLGNSLEFIGSYAFCGDTKVKSYEFPETLKTIDEGAFWANHALEEIILPYGIEIIRANTFRDCPNVTYIELPAKLTEIGEYAFEYLISLESIIIPPRVDKIDEGAFQNCKSLEEVIVYGTCRNLNNTLFRDASENFVIYGYEDTEIHRYALNNNISFEKLVDSEAPEFVKFEISAQSNKGFDIKTTVTDNVDIKYIRISYAQLLDESDTVLVTKDCAENEVRYNLNYRFETDSLTEGTYKVILTAEDINGNVYSEIKYVENDTTPPSVPSNVQTTGTPDYVHLLWNKEKVEKDFWCFYIYRSTGPDSGFEYIERVRSIGYFDSRRTAEENTTYYYYVTSVDKAGNESEPSRIVSGKISADTTEPEIGQFYFEDYSKLFSGFEKTVSVSVYDNVAVDKIYFKYRLKGSETWIDWAEDVVGYASYIFSVDLSFEGFEPGSYEMLCRITDKAGNVSKDRIIEFVVNSYSEIGAVVLTAESLHKALQLNWEYSGDEKAVDYYSVYRKDNESGEFILLKNVRSERYVDYKVELGEYIYKVAVTDIFGNTSESKELIGKVMSMDTEPPIVNSIISNLQTVVGKFVTFDAENAVDNDAIASYFWDFGDGKTSEKAYAEHMFKREGNYTVTLTVTDESGNYTTVDYDVSVIDLSLHPDKQFVKVNVSDSDGNRVSGVSIIATDTVADNSDEVTATTNKNGVAEFVLDKGNIYYLSACKENSEYSLSHTVVDLTEKVEPPSSTFSLRSLSAKSSDDGFEIYDAYVVDVVLRSNYFKGKISEPKIMSASEILAAGIPISSDTTLVSFQAEYAYLPYFEEEERTLSFTYYRSHNHCWFDWVPEDGEFYAYDGGMVTYGGYTYIPLPAEEPDAPDVYMLRISGEATCMNQVFQVDLIMLNSSPDDSMKNCKATINLPKGLKLVACDRNQKMEDIPEGGTGIATWYVMGTNPGQYNFSVDVEGTIYPEPLIEYTKTFKSSHPIIVTDLTGSMEVEIIPPPLVRVNEPAYVPVTFKNKSGQDLNFVNISAESNDDYQSVNLDTLSAGGSYTLTLMFIPTFDSDDPEIIYAYLAGGGIKYNDLPLKAYMGGSVKDKEEIDKELKTEIKLYKDKEGEEEIEELACSAGGFFLFDEYNRLEEIKDGELYLDGYVEYIGTSNLENSVVEPLENVKVKLTLPEGFSFERDEIKTEKEVTIDIILAGVGMKFRVPVYPLYSEGYKSDKKVKFTVKASAGLLLKDEYKHTVEIKKNEDEGEIPFRATIGASNLVKKGKALTGYQYIEWDIEQFTGKTDKYNHGLAKTLMAFSAAVYREDDIKRALKNMGFTNARTYEFPTPNDQIIPAGKEDGCSYAFATKVIIDEDDNISTIVLVLVRGTVQNEWYGNVNVGSGPEHYSFKYASEMVKDDFVEYYKELKEKELICENVVAGITGHSRGAAIANLLAGQSFDAGKIEDFSKKNVYVYTFATPNASVDAKSGSAYNNIFNIINPMDFVGSVPLSDWGYKKYGQNYSLYDYTDTSTREVSRMSDYYSQMKFSGGKKVNGIVKGLNLTIPAISVYVLNFIIYFISEITGKVKSGAEFETKPLKEVFSGWPVEAYVDAKVNLDHVGINMDEFDWRQLMFNNSFVTTVKTVTDQMDERLKNNPSYLTRNKTTFDKVVETVGYFANVLLLIDIPLRIWYEIFEYLSIATEEKALDYIGVCLVALEKVVMEKFNKTLWDASLKELASVGIDDMLKSPASKDDFIATEHSVETYMSWLEVKTPKDVTGWDIFFSTFKNFALDILGKFHKAFQVISTVDTIYSKILHVECPVNVEIYNSKGELVARVQGEEIDESIENMLDTDVIDGRKTFVLAPGENYTLKIIGYDDGTMNYYIEEYDETGAFIRRVSFENVKIEKDKTITASVDDVIETDAENYALTMPDESLLQCTEDKFVQIITASVESGEEVEEGTKIEFFAKDKEAKIYYTTDGSSPLDESNESRKLYNGAVELTETTTFTLCAFMEGDSDECKESSLATFAYVVKCKHKNLKKSDEIKPTCEFYGSNECYFCPDCRSTFADKNASQELYYSDLVIEATGHSWKAATCQTAETCTVCGATEGGTVTHADANGDYKCDYNCGYEYDSPEVPTEPSTQPSTQAPAVTEPTTKPSTSEEHKHTVVVIPAVSATYTKSGKTEGKKCSECGEILVEQKVVARKKLKKVTSLKKKAVKLNKGTKSTLTLSWKKVTGAKKYEIYQYVNKKWKKIKTTSKTTYKVTKLKANKSYKFKVRAVAGTNKGSFSKVLTAKTVPLKTTLTVKAGKKQLTASWKKVANITGYEVQYSTSKKFTKKTTKTSTIKKAKTTKKTIKSLKKGKKYYVRIRTYKVVNGKKIYSAWSSVKSVKIK